MKSLFSVNHVLISLFALATGVFKFLTRTDIDLFASIHFSAGMVLAVGAAQVASAIGLQRRSTARAAAVGLAFCNLLGTTALFAAHVQPFGAISVVFVAMALLEWNRGGARVAGPAVA